MKICTSIYYVLALLSCPTLWCSSPAPTPTQYADEINTFKTLDAALVTSFKTIIEQTKNIKKAGASLASIEQAQTEITAQQQLFERYKAQHLALKQTGLLRPELDKYIQERTAVVTPYISGMSHEFSQFVQNRKQLTDQEAAQGIALEMEREALIAKINHSTADNERVQAQAAHLANDCAEALKNGTSPEAIDLDRRTAALFAGAMNVEVQHAILRSETESFLNKTKSSQLQGNDSKQTQDK
jgi:hypothetical protein